MIGGIELMDNIDYIKGRKSEDSFKKYLEYKTDYIVKKSTLEEDRFKHIDFFVKDPEGNVFNTGEEEVSVDVKSKKTDKFSVDGAEIRGHFVEFQNVLGEKGWLLGEVDYIVFETVYYWIVVDRMTLFKFAYRTTDFSEKASRTKNGLDMYRKPYTRVKEGKKDIITKVNCLDLMYLAQISYPKKRKIYS